MNPRPFELILDLGSLPPAGGPVRRRRAVRAVILRDGRLLMVHSAVNGDWKFPGGGVEPGEGDRQALIREVAEETGYRTSGPFRPLGRVVERSAGRDIPGSRFEMESRYIETTVAGAPGPLDLDDYEKRLGFQAEWITVSEALAANRFLEASGREDLPPWLRRETAVLAVLEKIILCPR